jgi:hypothetical protein
LLFDFDALKSVVLYSNGKIYFKPDVKLTVKVTDSATVHQSAMKSFTDTIDSELPGEVEMQTRTLPTGKTGSAYVGQVKASGCSSPNLSVISGKVPDGLSLNAKTGLISGIPQALGDFTFTVQAHDSDGHTGSDTRVLAIRITDQWSWPWDR